MAQEAVAVKNYKYNVGMTCNACVGQIDNILKKFNEKQEDDKKFEYKINLEDKTVTVTGKVDGEAIGEKIKKWADLKEKSYEYVGEV